MKVRNILDTIIFDRIGEDKLVEYLRAKGFKVYKKMPISDEDIVSVLKLRGYVVDGFSDGVFDDSYNNSSRFVFDESLNKK